MKPSEQSFSTPQEVTETLQKQLYPNPNKLGGKGFPRVATRIALVAAFVGFVDATYLTLKHFLGSPVTCSLLEGCEVVTTSVYSTIGPFPISLFGSLYYLAVFLLLFAYRDTRRPVLFKLAGLLGTSGFFVSLVLLYLQAFVINAFCLYCLVSLATSTILFVCFLYATLRRS